MSTSVYFFLVELETYEARVAEVQRLTNQLPEPNKRMLELLLAHLEKVSQNSRQNMMTVSNLGVCFGPTLLRNEEETVAAIMDIKFGNVVVEILIENWRHILCGDPPKFRKQSQTSSSSLTVLPMNHSSSSIAGVHTSPRGNVLITPPHIVSPNRPPPPPYNPPPAPMTNSTSSLSGNVMHSNGPQQIIYPHTNFSPAQQHQGMDPLHQSPMGNQTSPMTGVSQPSFNSATWERPLRSVGGSSTSSMNKMFVPQPLGSAPPASTAHMTLHRPLQPSLSNSSVPTPQFSVNPTESNDQTLMTTRELQGLNPPPPIPPAKLHRQSFPLNTSGGSLHPSRREAMTEGKSEQGRSVSLKTRPKQPPPPTPPHPPYVDPPPVPRARNGRPVKVNDHGEALTNVRHRFSSSSSSVESYTSGGLSSNRDSYSTSRGGVVPRRDSLQSLEKIPVDEESYNLGIGDTQRKISGRSRDDKDSVASAIMAAESAVESSNAVVATAAMYGSPAVLASAQTATVQPIQQLHQTASISSSSPSSSTSSNAAAVAAISSNP